MPDEHTPNIKMQANKKIAIICFSNSLGGLELTALRLAEAMTKKGTSVLLIAPPSSPLAERASKANLGVAALAPRWKYGDFSTLIGLVRVLKAHQIDIVLLMQSKDIHLTAVASIFVPKLKLVYYQQMNSRQNKRDILHTWVYSKLALWFTLTKSMKNDVLASTRVPREKVNVVALGVDLQQFNPSQIKKSDAQICFGVPQDKNIVGVLGRLDKCKGQHIVLQAIPEVVKQHPNTFFLIAGDETAGEHGYREYLLELCRSLKIERSVKFIPFTEDVPRFMTALDVFVLPSFSETFGLVVVEAMAMERAIIATNSGGVPEIITNEKTGLLIRPQAVDEMISAICRVLSDAALRLSLGHSAREEALQRYDFDRCVSSLLGLFEEL
jgi:glycosyltransferase involved in cell wall biosynthesis